MKHLWTRRVIPRLGGCAVLALLTAFWAGPVRAEPGCGVARAVLEVEAAAAAMLAAESDAFAGAAVDELEGALGRLVARLGPRDPPRAGGAATPVGVYILSRRELVALYREQGLAAARARLRGAAFIAARQDLRPLLQPEGDCATPRLGAGADGSRERAPGSAEETPDSAALAPPAAPRMGTRPAFAAGAPRAPMGGSGALPAANIRAGLAILVVLGLLLLALLVLDGGGTREEARVICRIITQFRVRGVSQPAVIVELGRRSAKLRTEGQFLVGDRGVLAIGGATVSVRVAWVTPNFIGVAFQNRLGLSGEDLVRLSSSRAVL